MSLLMQKSSTCSLDQSATVPASFRVRTPTPTTPDPLGPTPSPLLALPPTYCKCLNSVHAALETLMGEQCDKGPDKGPDKAPLLLPVSIWNDWWADAK